MCQSGNRLNYQLWEIRLGDENATSMDVYVSSSSPSSRVTQELVRADATCFPANSSFIVGVVLCRELDSSFFHRKFEYRGSVPKFVWRERVKPFEENHPQHTQPGFKL
uniref:Uncharacterized protein n=1 Tax=Timema poppense TaxID=170557 RepID=A0A7R9HAR9_TIMPO|nr:unnamed protein product [Timema poppensis]